MGKNKCEIGKNKVKKGTIGVEKDLSREGNIISFFGKRKGGINIVFGPKYRPLEELPYLVLREFME